MSSPASSSDRASASLPLFDKNPNVAQNYLMLEHKRICPYEFRYSRLCPQGKNCAGVDLCRQFILDGNCQGGLNCSGGAHEIQHCYAERDSKMCDVIRRAGNKDFSADYQASIVEHSAAFWHMDDLEGKDKISVSRRILDGKVEAHVQGEYLVKEDVWEQGWMCLYNKDGWYMLRVGRAAPAKS